MVMPPFTIIIFINVTSPRSISVADERISLIGNTDAGAKANYIELILLPLSYTAAPRALI